MNFDWAVQQMKEGKKVRRKSWDEGLFVFLNHVGYFETNSGSLWAMKPSHFEVLDWAFFEKPKETLSDKKHISGKGHEFYYEGDVREFIDQTKTTIRELLYDDKAIQHIITDIDKNAGERFKTEG